MDVRAKQIRKQVLAISCQSGHGHIPTCFSVVELLLAVYDTMHHFPDKPAAEDRDIFILSKGHAALAHYCVLAQWGYFPLTSVYSFGAFNSAFGCHADRRKVPGIEASTGSLGQGIGIAVGMALGMKISRHPGKVFVLIGDGEANEGCVWEAVMVAVNQKLDNLVIILDYNRSQSRCLPLRDPEKIFAAWGCCTIGVWGHSVSGVCEALRQRPQGAPLAVIAETVKGYGSTTLTEEVFAWHRRSPCQEELEFLMRELDESII